MPSSVRRNRVQYGMIGNSETNEGMSKGKIQLIKKQKLNHYEDLETNVMWFDSESSEELWTVCTVCLEDITVDDWYKQLPKCGHYFHAECIDRWLAMRALCPVCREVVGDDDVVRKSPSCSFRTPRITFISPRRSLSLRRSFEYWTSVNGGSTEKMAINEGSTEKMAINEGSTEKISDNGGSTENPL